MKKYFIKKGNHSYLFWWLDFFKFHWNKTEWNIKFKLDNNCWWPTPRNNDDYDINKLCGVGFGLNHHKNSCRLGWVPDFDNENIFKLYAYVYDTNIHKHVCVEMGKFNANLIYTCKIISKDNKYYFISDIGNVEVNNNIKDSKLQFELYFYHGGDNTALNDETAYIELIFL